ncbi:unnamed protein product [Closterium sp. NIES-53]
MPLASSRTSMLSSSPTATAPTAATAAATAASTTALKAPTPTTTPTAATTSTASITSIAAFTTTPAATSTTPATLALAAVVLPTSGSSSNILSTKDVNSSSRGVGGGKGGAGTPLKDGCARSATSSTYSDYTSLICKELFAVCLRKLAVDTDGKDIEKLRAAVPPDLAELIQQYPDIFPDDLPPGLPPETPEDHKIQLESSAQPTVQKQWRLTQPELEELRSQIDALLEKGFIRASASPFVAPIC